MEIKRSAGILMPISSLPNIYGIGTLGKCAYDFIDFLSKANQSYWQILPLGHTSYKDSPYQTFSAFAGNPYFIDLDFLKNEDLLKYEEYQHLKTSENNIDYGFLYHNRYNVLKIAYSRFKKDKLFKEFVKTNKDWLNDYSLFMSLKSHFNGIGWQSWNSLFKTRNRSALASFKKEYASEICFWQFVQFMFFKQWKNVKEYANSKGIKIIGDIPIYVAMDSCDVWANPKYFQLDENLNPLRVAGCPPDDFSADGQLWGNPVYNYKTLKEDNYSWWIKRMKHSLEVFDIARIDHFRGFEAFWSVDAKHSTAKSGKWVKGPNVKLFKAMEKELGELNIIVEDLGFLTDSVYKMINKLGYPGMQVLEFGFDPWSDSYHAPHNIKNNSIVYTSSHDLAPLKGWYESLPYQNKRYILEYLCLENDQKIVEALIKRALSSNASLVIVPMQDYLELGNDARLNTPSTSENNWKWRASESDLIDDVAYRIRHFTKQYRR